MSKYSEKYSIVSSKDLVLWVNGAGEHPYAERYFKYEITHIDLIKGVYGEDVFKVYYKYLNEEED